MRRVHSMIYRKSSPVACERGVIIAEFALTLPLLALIFLTIVDLSLVIHEHQVLQNAAREGAHFSALPRNQIGPQNPVATQNAIKQRVIDYCQGENITVLGGDITVSQQRPITVAGGLTVMASEVRVSYTRNFLVGGVPFLPVGQITLFGNSVFRNLY